jgi:hypothetical protein
VAGPLSVARGTGPCVLAQVLKKQDISFGGPRLP